MLSGLSAIGGATAYPIYSLNAPPGGDVVSCPAMRALAVFGQCAPGVAAVFAGGAENVFSDNPSDYVRPFVSASDRAYTGTLSSLRLHGVLVQANSPAVLERVRTFLAIHAPSVNSVPGSPPMPPRTFGELLNIRLGRAATVEKIVYAAVALTLIVAGCSLAVAVGGGLVDRKRPFTLLRVSGTQVGVLSKAVLLEAGQEGIRAGTDLRYLSEV